jgi:AraC-like DNA-binding protein
MSEPEVEDWVTVVDAIRKRMRELKMSTAHIARESGISETTLRGLGKSLTGHNRSTLVAISAVLRWRYDHLTNILHGEPEKNVHIKRRTEDDMQRLFRDEFIPVIELLANFEEIIQKVDTRLEIMSGIQRRASA